MSDLISRQAAIDAIENYIENNRHPDFIGNMVWVNGVADAMRIVRDLPSVQEQRWIPVTEKYPDMGERVLVYTVYHEYHVWDCMSNRGEYYFWEDEDGLYHNKYQVDLWMPIPEI